MQLLDQLNPKAVFSGHTHHGCVYNHGETVEYSVASFSWRNRNNPNYLLVSFASDNYAVEKCFMPRESTVFIIYIFMFLILTAGIFGRFMFYIFKPYGRFKFS